MLPINAHNYNVKDTLLWSLPVLHGAVTTALVFIVLQIVAFTMVFNKTYFQAINTALRAPQRGLAYAAAKASPDELLLMTKQVADFCKLDEAQSKAIQTKAKEFIETNVQPTDEEIWPEEMAMVLFGFAFIITGVMAYFVQRSRFFNCLFFLRG